MDVRWLEAVTWLLTLTSTTEIQLDGSSSLITKTNKLTTKKTLPLLPQNQTKKKKIREKDVNHVLLLSEKIEKLGLY